MGSASDVLRALETAGMVDGTDFKFDATKVDGSGKLIYSLFLRKEQHDSNTVDRA